MLFYFTFYAAAGKRKKAEAKWSAIIWQWLVFKSWDWWFSCRKGNNSFTTSYIIPRLWGKCTTLTFLYNIMSNTNRSKWVLSYLLRLVWGLDTGQMLKLYKDILVQFAKSFYLETYMFLCYKLKSNWNKLNSKYVTYVSCAIFLLSKNI